MIASSYNNPLIALFDILSVWSSIDDLICTGDGGARLEPLLLYYISTNPSQLNLSHHGAILVQNTKEYAWLRA